MARLEVGAASLQRGRRRSSPESSATFADLLRSTRSFNGAGDVHRRRGDAPPPPRRHLRTLQRGRRRSSPESRVDVAAGRGQARGFNGAGDVHRRRARRLARASDRRASLQRGRRRSSPESATNRVVAVAARRFNGAGDVHRRRGSRPDGCKRATSVASTGPATFIAGEGLPRRAQGRRAARFNGAGDVHRRRAPRPQRSERPPWSASTGPATFIAGEASRCARLGSTAAPASTGPATFIAGERRVVRCVASLRAPLQRGRRRSSPESHARQTRLMRRLLVTLQRGRRRSSPERRRRRRVDARAASRFNGAGDVHRRRATCAAVSGDGVTRASTGPATFIAGERVVLPRRSRPQRRFNGAGDVHRRRGVPEKPCDFRDLGGGLREALRTGPQGKGGARGSGGCRARFPIRLSMVTRPASDPRGFSITGPLAGWRAPRCAPRCLRWCLPTGATR